MTKVFSLTPGMPEAGWNLKKWSHPTLLTWRGSEALGVDYKLHTSVWLWKGSTQKAQRLNPKSLLLAQCSFQSSMQNILSRIPTKPLTRPGVSKLWPSRRNHGAHHSWLSSRKKVFMGIRSRSATLHRDPSRYPSATSLQWLSYIYIF